MTLFYEGILDGFPIPLCRNVMDARFFSLEKAVDMDLAFDHGELIRRYHKKRRLDDLLRYAP